MDMEAELERGVKMQAYLITALAAIVIMVIFVFQNPQTVTISFLTFSSPPISLALVVLLAAAAGALITLLIDSFRHLKTVQRLREEKIKGKKLKSELEKVKPPAVE